MKHLIIGLGNTGESYALTRHNIGFMAIDHIAASHHVKTSTSKLASKTEVSYKGRCLHLIKPSGYINQSGKAVNYWIHQLTIPKSNLLIILDDTALPFGQVRLRGKGSHGGHNGLRHIEEWVQETNFPRLRIGVGDSFPKGKKAEYVLSPFSPAEQKTIPKILEKVMEITHSFCWAGLERTMSTFNGSCI